MKDKHALGQAVGFTSTISLIFMICYTFNMTKTPFFLMLISIMSFGYTLCLLAFNQSKKKASFYVYFSIGLLLIFICVALSFTTPHESSLFN